MNRNVCRCALLTGFALILVALDGLCATAMEEVQLCQPVLGFADKINNEFDIAVRDGSEGDEVIVLTLRTFPVHFGQSPRPVAHITATYELGAARESSTRVSDPTGVLTLSSVARESKIHVTVSRAGGDAAVPFEFYSFHANRPTCFIDVSPSNSFVAPVPRTASPSGLEIFFRTTVPARVKDSAAAIHISPSGGVASDTSFMELIENQPRVPHSSGDVVRPSTGNTILFSVQTTQISPLTNQMHVSTQNTVWSPDGNSPAGGRNTDDDDNNDNAGGGAGRRGSSARERSKPDEMSVGRFLLMVLLLFLAYLIGGAVYNVRVRHITEFPEMIPLSAQFIALGRFLQLSYLRLTGRHTGRSSAHYDTLYDGRSWE